MSVSLSECTLTIAAPLVLYHEALSCPPRPKANVRDSHWRIRHLRPAMLFCTSEGRALVPSQAFSAHARVGFPYGPTPELLVEAVLHSSHFISCLSRKTAGARVGVPLESAAP